MEDLPDKSTPDKSTPDKSTRPIGKLKEWKQVSLLNINPSYGVLPRLPENAEETKGAITKDAVYDDVQIRPKTVEKRKGSAVKEVVYANDPPKRPENADITKGGTIKDAVYDDVQIHPKNVEKTKGGTIKELVYANDPTAVVEDYEYMNLPSRSREQSRTPNNQSPTRDQFTSSSQYEIPCI